MLFLSCRIDCQGIGVEEYSQISGRLQIIPVMRLEVADVCIVLSVKDGVLESIVWLRRKGQAMHGLRPESNVVVVERAEIAEGIRVWVVVIQLGDVNRP